MTTIMIFRAQGSLIEQIPLQAQSLDNATLLTGHGVYSVLRVYSRLRVLRLDRHLARLRQSAQRLGMTPPMSDGWFRSVIKQCVEKSEFDEARVRLTVPFDTPDQAIISVENFKLPPENLYADGVKVGLVEAARPDPTVKNSKFIEQRQSIVEEAGSGWYEVMMRAPDGRILEGTGSNFYGVVNGKLRTASEGMLEGIARGLLLDIAPNILPVELLPIYESDLPTLAEAMLTSASRGVVPVVQVRDVVIGAGTPGPITRQLRDAYERKVETELEDL